VGEAVVVDRGTTPQGVPWEERRTQTEFRELGRCRLCKRVYSRTLLRNVFQFFRPDKEGPIGKKVRVTTLEGGPVYPIFCGHGKQPSVVAADVGPRLIGELDQVH
jgi:hypothetical protein